MGLEDRLEAALEGEGEGQEEEIVKAKEVIKMAKERV